MEHKHPKWVKDPYVPRKVIHLNVVRFARDLNACAKAKAILDDHDRAKMWDKAHNKVDEFIKTTDKPNTSDGYWTEEEALNSVMEDQEDDDEWDSDFWESEPRDEDDPWQGNEDGGS
jgi:hypothetical protein